MPHRPTKEGTRVRKKRPKSSSSTMAQVQGDDSLNEIPNLKLPQLLYAWEKTGATPQTGLEGIMAIVQKNDMAPFYADCCVKYGWVVNEELMASMR